MLVLSRKMKQTIVIDGQIEIEVLKVKGNTVRLGIKAPQDIKVLRGELSTETEIASVVGQVSNDTQQDFQTADFNESMDQLPNPFATIESTNPVACAG